MRTIFRVFLIAGFCAATLAGLGAAQAASSECKGLEKPACETDGGCSWVKSYKTAKGREVSAFCRKKPERKKSTQAISAPTGS